MKKEQTLHNPFKTLGKSSKYFAVLLPMLLLTICLETAQAAPIFWDPAGSLTAPTDGNGNWDDTTVSNWLSAGVLTTNDSTSASTANAIIGGNVPGTYSITNIVNPVTASTLTFSNANGYTIYGSQLNLTAASGTPGLVALPNTTNTIMAAVRMSNTADWSNAPASSLTFGGGSGGAWGGNPRMVGISYTNSFVNLIGGTFTPSGTLTVEGVTVNITNSIVNGLGRLDLGRNQANATAAFAACAVNVYNGG